MQPAPAPVTRVRRRKTTQALLLVLLLPVFVLVWLPLLRSRGDSTRVAGRLADPAPAVPTSTPPNAAPMVETTTTAPVAAGSPQAIAELGRRIRALAAPYDPRWQGPVAGSNPVPAATPEAAAPASPPVELVPSAILLAPGTEPVAIVQGMPVRIGDARLGLTLVAIHAHDVQWRRGESTFVVSLPSKALGGSR